MKLAPNSESSTACCIILHKLYNSFCFRTDAGTSPSPFCTNSLRGMCYPYHLTDTCNPQKQAVPLSQNQKCSKACQHFRGFQSPTANIDQYKNSFFIRTEPLRNAAWQTLRAQSLPDAAIPIFFYIYRYRYRRRSTAFFDKLKRQEGPCAVAVNYTIWSIKPRNLASLFH